MPTTIEGAAVFVALVAPGLLFELGLSQGANYLRRGWADRLLRFFAWSALVHVVSFPASVAVYRTTQEGLVNAGIVSVGLLWVWLMTLALGPYYIGISLGREVPREKLAASGWRAKTARWRAKAAHAVFGDGPEPLAWNWLWKRSQPGGGYIRVRLRESGDWIAGQWAYAADDPDDLLIDRFRCSRLTGELKLDDEGLAETLGWRTLVRVSDLDRIEFQPLQAEETPDGRA